MRAYRSQWWLVYGALVTIPVMLREDLMSYVIEVLWLQVVAA